MRHQTNLSVETLECKNLLSHVAVGMIGARLHGGGIAAPRVIGTPVHPVPGVPVSSLETSITTNQASYTPGQVVKMSFTVTNDTASTVRVPIGPSIDGFSVTFDGKTIWRSNSGVEPDYIALRKLAPGQSITLKAAWTATSSMSGTFAVHNQLDPSDSATFEIGTSPDVSPLEPIAVGPISRGGAPAGRVVGTPVSGRASNEISPLEPIAVGPISRGGAPAGRVVGTPVSGPGSNEISPLEPIAVGPISHGGAPDARVIGGAGPGRLG